jgi:putative tricarboxylic transport membrane protein
MMRQSGPGFHNNHGDKAEMDNVFRKGDFWAGLSLAALGTYIVSTATQWVYLGEDGPGAGFFPTWYGIAMVVCSLLLVAGAVLKHDESLRTRRINWKEMSRALICWAAFAVSIALLNVVGFIVAFALLTWFIVAIMFRRPQRVALAVAIGGAIGFYLVFSVGLDIQLPSGMFF